MRLNKQKVYKNYDPSWKLKKYTTDSKSVKISIKKEHFTSELKQQTLKTQQNLKNFVESLNKDMCQKSLHIVQKRCNDFNLHVSSNNNKGELNSELKVEQIVYYTVFQNYLHERIWFIEKGLKLIPSSKKHSN